jgi:hypothetical protein
LISNQKEHIPSLPLAERAKAKNNCKAKWLFWLLAISWPLLFEIAAANADVISGSSGQVSKVYRLVNGVQTNEVRLGDWLTVDLQGLSLQQQNFATQYKSKLTLFLGDVPIKGLCTDLCVATNTGQAELRFHLQRVDSVRDDWAALLGSPGHFLLPMHVSVGLGDDAPLSSVNDTVGQINFVVINESWFWVCVMFAVLLFLGVFALATKTNALRDDGPELPAGQLRTYSLARCQMAFWLVLVLPTFIFLWLVTGAYDTLTSSVLVLMGVSAGTTIFAHAQAKPVAGPLGSKSFVEDALKDDAGSTSFSHFQMFIWTIVLGCIFITEVWQNLAMPEFSNNLLDMMGISSGTYLGFILTAK